MPLSEKLLDQYLKGNNMTDESPNEQLPPRYVIEDANPMPAMTPLTPMAMIGQALASGKSLEVLKEFMILQERWEASEGRKAFAEAFAKFKGEVITVIRNRSYGDGPLKGKKYAELFSFIDAATPALSKHDLSASFAITKDDKDWLEVTCTIEHPLGGTKTAKLGGPPDMTGAKNPLQARISTVTYLKKETFKSVCGLAEKGDDDDGMGAWPKNGGGSLRTITEEEIAELRNLLEAAERDEGQLLAYVVATDITKLSEAQFLKGKAKCIQIISEAKEQ